MGRKRKKLKKEVYTCPCCGQKKDKSELSFVISASKVVATNVNFCQQCWGIVEERSKNPFYLPYNRWACDACINKRIAKLANPGRQQYEEHLPYFAYFDKEYTCKSCNKIFVFSKEEQCYWFENLRFWGLQDFVPANCPRCRKEQRIHKQLQNRLMELLKRENIKDVHILKEISDIYAQMGNQSKSELYIRRANKITCSPLSCGSME